MQNKTAGEMRLFSLRNERGRERDATGLSNDLYRLGARRHDIVNSTTIPDASTVRMLIWCK